MRYIYILTVTHTFSRRFVLDGRLIAASEKRTILRAVGSEDGSEEEDGELSDFDEHDEGSVATVDRPQRAQIERDFERTLEEYDSDECGPLEGPEDDPTLQGQLALDSESLTALLDEYLEVTEKERGRFTLQRGKAAAEARAKAHAEIQAEAQAEAQAKAQAEAQAGEGSGAVIASVVEGKGVSVATADDLNEGSDGGSESSGIEDYMPEYLREKPTSAWDCESIISTYSNLDNHPTRLSHPKPPRKKDAANPPPRDAPKRIVLSSKSGLPVGVLDARGPATDGDDSEDEEEPEGQVNKGAARSRDETPEERRARKALVKEERMKKRSEKREVKAAFKKEDIGSQRRVALSGSGPGAGGVAVFKY